jgi:hypothetical protein
MTYGLRQHDISSHVSLTQVGHSAFLVDWNKTDVVTVGGHIVTVNPNRE